MNSDAPHTPFHYLKRFNINSITRQNMIGVHKFLIYNEKNLLSENNSYKKYSTMSSRESVSLFYIIIIVIMNTQTAKKTQSILAQVRLSI